MDAAPDGVCVDMARRTADGGETFKYGGKDSTLPAFRGGGKDSSLPDNTFKSAILSPEINFSCPPFAKVL